MVIHSDARPFNCPYCSATFKRKDKLKYHVDHVHNTRYTVQSVGTLNRDKLVTNPYEEPAKAFNEPKPAGQSSPSHASVCVPLTLVSVSIDGAEQRESHRAVQAQGQQSYQSATELAFLEKYTLTPQPANVVHLVRPDQMLDPREQSYLGTLLGLESAASVSSVANSENTH